MSHATRYGILFPQQKYSSSHFPLWFLTQDQELFSNYGALSNEVLMYAYGFALENNPFDTVTLKLVSGAGDVAHNKDTRNREERVYQISAGGISGVPKVFFCLHVCVQSLYFGSQTLLPSHYRCLINPFVFCMC